MRACRVIAILLGVALSCGCERPHSDMGEQDKHETHQPSRFFADGSSARPLVSGVVPRGGDDAAPSERVAADAVIPFPVDRFVLARGQESFEVFCAACHGRVGDGDGMIVRRGFTRPPSFHLPRLRSAADGHFYDVISNGYGAMYSYNDRVTPTQRWEIIAYIRALQLALDRPGATLTGDERRTLTSTGGQRPTTGGAP